jgi:hypothetical protein
MEAEPSQAPLPDTMNVLALVSTVQRLGDVEHLPADQRSTVIQRLGQEIEDRARTLIEQTQRYRGVAEDRPPLSLVPQAPAQTSKPADLSARVRDALLKFRDGFTVDELAAELGVSVPIARKLIKPHELSGAVFEVGRVSRRTLYQYNKPKPAGGSGPSSHPTKTPEWRDNPAYTEARATGMPVRVAAMAKLTRKGRSTSGVQHHHRMRDKRFEEMMDAAEKRRNEQRFKHLKEDQAGRRAPGGKKKRK